MRLYIEDGVSVGLELIVEFGQSPSTPSDADLIALATDVLNSDAVQNMSWTGTPALNQVTVPDVRILYP